MPDSTWTYCAFRGIFLVQNLMRLYMLLTIVMGEKGAIKHLVVLQEGILNEI